MFVFLIGKMLKVFHSISLVLYRLVLYCMKFSIKLIQSKVICCNKYWESLLFAKYL